MLHLQRYRCARCLSSAALLAICLCLMTGASLSFADDPPCPPAPTAIVEQEVHSEGVNSAIAMRACGEFIVAYEREIEDPHVPPQLRRDIFVQRVWTLHSAALPKNTLF